MWPLGTGKWGRKHRKARLSDSLDVAFILRDVLLGFSGWPEPDPHVYLAHSHTLHYLITNNMNFLTLMLLLTLTSSTAVLSPLVPTPSLAPHSPDTLSSSHCHPRSSVSIVTGPICTDSCRSCGLSRLASSHLVGPRPPDLLRSLDDNAQTPGIFHLEYLEG